MNKVLISIIIFGLIHPLSKVLLSTGIPFSYFCILYIGIRLLTQIVYFIFSNKRISHLSSNITKLLGLGLIGASLQFFEFKGIEKGIPPEIVTLLMFSYPIWTTLFEIIINHKTKSLKSIISPIFVLLGIFLISGLSSPLQIKLNENIVFPLMAGLSIAIWIIYSSKLSKSGINASNLSLFYDLFSFLALLLFLGNDLVKDYSLFINWIDIFSIFYMSLFSILIGLLPNILFYQGSKRMKNDNIGMVMAFEPIFSVFYSFLIWNISFNIKFILGVLFIIMANIPQLFSQNISIKKIIINIFNKHIRNIHFS